MKRRGQGGGVGEPGEATARTHSTLLTGERGNIIIILLYCEVIVFHTQNNTIKNGDLEGDLDEFRNRPRCLVQSVPCKQWQW